MEILKRLGGLFGGIYEKAELQSAVYKIKKP